MSRIKHVLTRAVLAVALMALPVVPLAATATPAHPPVVSAVRAAGDPACIGCW